MGVESVSWPWGGAAAAAACKTIRLINHVAHTDAGNTTLGIENKKKKTWPIIIFTTDDDDDLVSDHQWIPICSHFVVTVGCVEFAAIYVQMERESQDGRILFRLESKTPLAQGDSLEIHSLASRLFLSLEFSSSSSINTRDSPYNSLLSVCRMLSIPWSTKCVHGRRKGGPPCQNV